MGSISCQRPAPAVCYDSFRDHIITLRPLQPLAAPRRRFLARFGIGSAAIGALLGLPMAAGAQPSSAPKRHENDDWMDALPTAHRMVFDAVSAAGADDIRHYASNVFTANRTGYGLESRDVGVLVILRHNATPLAFNDAMWAKYGSVFAAEMKVVDPKTQKAPATNPGQHRRRVARHAERPGGALRRLRDGDAALCRTRRESHRRHR